MDRWCSLDLVLRYRGVNSVKVGLTKCLLKAQILFSLSKGMLFCLNQFSIKRAVWSSSLEKEGVSISDFNSAMVSV
jgi:hypothetical protein